METLANKTHTRAQAVAMLVIVAVLWSMGGFLIKMIPWHPLAIAGGRSAISAVIFLAVIRKPVWTGSVAQIGAALAYSGTVILFVTATKMTTAANAILLQYTAPVYVALFGAWLIRERTSRADWITVICVLGGMALFFVDKVSPGNLIGNILAVLSGVCFALFALFMRMQKDGSPLESVLFGNILTLLISLPVMFNQPMLNANGFLALGTLGVFQLGVSYVLYCIAIKHVTALDAILIPVIEPILNPVWVLLILAEKPGIWALCGGIIVICAVTMRCLLPVLAKQKADTAAS